MFLWPYKSRNSLTPTRLQRHRAATCHCTCHSKHTQTSNKFMSWFQIKVRKRFGGEVWHEQKKPNLVQIKSLWWIIAAHLRLQHLEMNSNCNNLQLALTNTRFRLSCFRRADSCVQAFLFRWLYFLLLFFYIFSGMLLKYVWLYP